MLFDKAFFFAEDHGAVLVWLPRSHTHTAGSNCSKTLFLNIPGTPSTDLPLFYQISRKNLRPILFARGRREEELAAMASSRQR
jgi:hypothetical protein